MTYKMILKNDSHKGFTKIRLTKMIYKNEIHPKDSQK